MRIQHNIYRAVGVAALTMTLGACVQSSVMQMNADTVQISTRSAPICGLADTGRIAMRRAAVETLNRGFDKYIVLDVNSGRELAGFMGGSSQTSATATAMPYSNTVNAEATTTYSPPQPLFAHRDTVMVRMFHDSDADGGNAIPARGILGPDWEKIVAKKGGSTCME